MSKLRSPSASHSIDILTPVSAGAPGSLHRRSSGCRYPSVDEILKGKAPEPFSLTAFKKYVAQNHCSENVEFIVDVQNYKSLYNESHEKTTILQLNKVFNDIIDTYIRPNSKHELNLSCESRHRLVDVATELESIATPADPSCFDDSCHEIQELIRECTYVSFVNLFAPSSFEDVQSPIAASKSPTNSFCSNDKAIYSTIDSHFPSNYEYNKPSANPIAIPISNTNATTNLSAEFPRSSDSISEYYNSTMILNETENISNGSFKWGKKWSKRLRWSRQSIQSDSPNPKSL